MNEHDIDEALEFFIENIAQLPKGDMTIYSLPWQVPIASLAKPRFLALVVECCMVDP